MVARAVVVFEAICRGTLDWRVCVDGADEHVPFANRESCIAAATTRARLRHVDTGATTEVWAPGYGSKRECLIRYMTPVDLDELLLRSTERVIGCDGESTTSVRGVDGDDR